MAENMEMVLVSRDELQQLIGASVRCALEEYGQAQAPQVMSNGLCKAVGCGEL